MIKSMTGFASLTRDDESTTIGVTIRAVNHRFLDLQLRTPASIGTLEPRLRALVQQRVARGRIEVSITLQQRRAPAVEVELNEPFLDGLCAALDRARARGLVAGPLTPGDLLRLPQAVAIRDKSDDDQAAQMAAVGDKIEAAVAAALDDLDAMRAREGTYLRTDLDARRQQLGIFYEKVTAAAAEGLQALQARLAERVRELRADSLADEAAVAQEIARFAARSDITEEAVRFRGHLDHWQALTDSPEPCGRKLDFLLQEMNREVNTTASKAEGAAVSELIVSLKAELEKMREQVQNVE
jgi:uncharacterized protein (TIGR00255 family)